MYRYLNQEYEAKLDVVQRKLGQLYRENPTLRVEQQIKAKRRSLYAEHEIVRRLEQNAMISGEVAELQQNEIIELLMQVEELNEHDLENLDQLERDSQKSPSKSVWIISDKCIELGDALLKQLGHGVTYLQGEGAYSGEGKKVIFSVISRSQEEELQKIVKHIDPNAFLAIGNINDVQGGRFQDND